MKRKIKLLPLAMTILSFLYLIYVLSSEDTTLVADTVGGDPGGKVLPAIIAVFMIAGFLWITIKERPSGKPMEKETAILFVITLGLSLVYIFLMKPVGFVILSTVLLYVLIYLYTTIGEKRNALRAVSIGVGSVALTSGVYTLMRLIAKTLSRSARKGAIPYVFANSSVTAVMSLAFVTVVVIILCFTLLKLLKKVGCEREGNATVISLATVLFLYVVFKQFFLVGLAPGLLNF